jgi:hypothetical protein
MRWYHHAAYFFGGVFLANFVPHFVAGVTGRAFQTPFASPPAVGLSSSTLNVIWGLSNAIVAYLLLAQVGTFDVRRLLHVTVGGTGFALMSIYLARGLGRFYGGML